MIEKTRIKGIYLYWALGKDRSLAKLIERYGLDEPQVHWRACEEGWDDFASWIDHLLDQDVFEVMGSWDMDAAELMAMYSMWLQLEKARAVDAITRLPLPEDAFFSFIPMDTAVVVRVGLIRRPEQCSP